MSIVLAQQDDIEKRKRGVRRTAIVFGLIALFFYVGFIVLTLVKGSK
jgi:Na+/melibiose symporter-like transporter